MERIAVVGAGLMGHRIAQVFAASGHEVMVTDSNTASLASVGHRVRANLVRMVAHGIALADSPEAIVNRIRTTEDLGATCGTADIVVERPSKTWN
jgi:3-hydroxybutyryl-CoA dehydrogenase